jgi:hypothetical protein
MGALDDKPFEEAEDTAEGDKGMAMKRDPRYDGLPEESMLYEGMRAYSNTSAAQMGLTGRE